MFIKMKSQSKKRLSLRNAGASFKTSLNYKNWTIASIIKQLSSDITQFFAGHCLMASVNIQA